MISAWLANSEFNKMQQEKVSNNDEDDSDDELVFSDDSDDDDDDDMVSCEVGESSSDDEQSDEGSVNPVPSLNTRVGRRVTTYLTRRYFGDTDWLKYFLNKQVFQ